MPRRNTNAGPKAGQETPARRTPAVGGTKLDKGGRPVTDDGGRPAQLDTDGKPGRKGRASRTATQVPEGWSRLGGRR